MIKGVFITGVDTGVGKSAISAGLLRLLQGKGKSCYWKPVQTGTLVSDDTVEVKRITALPDECFEPPTYTFVEPLAPYVAAKKWGKRIEIDALVEIGKRRMKDGYTLIVEGSGGLLIPFNEQELQIDLIKRLGLPVIFVTEDRMGAINQTLLTLKVAREAQLDVLGIVMTRSRRSFGNSECIAEFGKVEILAELDPSEDLHQVVAQVAGHERLRKLFDVAPLP